METVTEKTHAELSPSGASRWMRCPGSVVLERGRPNRPSIHAAWGTAAHEVADLCLRPYADKTAAEPLDAEGFVGRKFQIDGFDVEVDMEMADCVNTYLSHIQALIAVECGDILYPEQRLDISFLTGEAGAAGTSDAIGITRAGRTLVVADLKGGRGVRVDADTEQLHMYAAAALREYDLLYPIEDVLLVIIQPRLGHVDEYRITVDELRAFEENVRVATHAVREADRLNALGETVELQPGEKQCRFCKAKAICPSLRGEVEASIAKTAPADRDDFADLSLPKQVAAATGAAVMQATNADKLAEAMRAAPLIEAWLKDVRAETERRLLDGQPVAGFKLVEGRQGNRSWADPDAAAEALKKARLKADQVYDKSVISVAAAEKLLKPDPKKWAKIAPLIDERAEGKPSVAPESDKRPAWTPAAVADDFGDLTADTGAYTQEMTEQAAIADMLDDPLFA